MVSASDAQAEEMVNVDGVEYPLSLLTANCQSMSGDPQAMIACFNDLSALMEGNSDVQEDTVSVAQALDDLRAVAQYQNDETGLSILGSDCGVHIVYYGNFFHISRRNVSSIDLVSAQFDASKLQYDQIAGVQGAQMPLSRGLMDVGAAAKMRGGAALESAQHNFPAKSARLSMSEYAAQVVNQLPVTEGQAFNFVLVHPARSQASADIWSAFEVFVNACSSKKPEWAFTPRTN